MGFFFIWLCQNRSFCQILPNWNFLFYLKCRFKTVDLIEPLSFISNMKKSYQMFFYQRKFDRMSRRTGKCFDQNCMSRICYEMLVYGSLGRKGEHGEQSGVSSCWLSNSSTLFHLDLNLIVPGAFKKFPSEDHYWKGFFSPCELGSKSSVYCFQ